MIRDSLSMLQYEAKRNSELASIIQNINFISEEEIKNLKKISWIRNALLLLKKKNNFSNLSHALNSILDNKQQMYYPDLYGETRRWVGGDAYIKMGKNHALIEIKTNQMVWFGPNGIWLDTIYSKIIDPMFYSNTISVGKMSKLEYFEAERMRRNGSIISAPHTVLNDSLVPASAAKSSSQGFSIYRI